MYLHINMHTRPYTYSETWSMVSLPSNTERLTLPLTCSAVNSAPTGREVNYRETCQCKSNTVPAVCKVMRINSKIKMTCSCIWQFISKTLNGILHIHTKYTTAKLTFDYSVLCTTFPNALDK